MPILEVETKSAEQVWASPDGQRKIYKLGLEFEGKPVLAKTYSDAIATVGWSGTVETYEKPGRNGSETFVKQPPKEGGSYGTGSSSGGSNSSNRSGTTSGYTKDEKAIQAMWAIGQAVQLYNSNFEGQAKRPEPVPVIEALAQDVFAMVDRVKASEDAPAAGEDVIVPMPDDFGLPEPEDLKTVLGDVEDKE